MPSETCILTIRDFAMLEGLSDGRLSGNDPLVPILRRKIDRARVVFRADVPANVATLSSRVTFSVDGRDPETGVLSRDRMAAGADRFVPISTPRGLALLGLAEGQEFVITNGEGSEERIRLETVEYQPEAARRAKEDSGAPAQRKPALKLIRGSNDDPRRLAAATADGPDDPGPSAA